MFHVKHSQLKKNIKRFRELNQSNALYSLEYILIYERRGQRRLTLHNREYILLYKRNKIATKEEEKWALFL